MDNSSSAGSAFNGTIVNGATWTSGETGDGLTLNGTNQYVDVPYNSTMSNDLDFGTGGFTISTWVKLPSGDPFSDVTYPILSFGSLGSPDSDVTLALASNGTYEWTLGLYFQDIQMTGGNYTTWVQLCPMPDVSNIFRDDQWHMVTITRNNNNVGRLYLDGSPLPINLGGGQGRVLSLDMGGLVDNIQDGDYDLYLGRDIGGWNYFDGSLDDIRVYDRALSASEIEALASPTEVSVQGTASAAEPSTPGTFTVSRVGVLGSNLTVLYTVSGTAVAGTNYVALPGSVVIPAGQSSATITVTPINDYSLDFTQTIVVTLQSANDYELGSSPSASIDLLDDNVPTVTLAMTQNYASETDLGAGLFTLTRSGTGPALTANALSVYYTIGGTAVSGVDYAALSGVATIPAGQTSATIPVTPLGDTMSVSDATVSLRFPAARTRTDPRPAGRW